METNITIEQWGNGLGINIPSVIANGMSLKEGLSVNVQRNGRRIIIEPSLSHISYNLNEMLSEITDDNIHQYIETGNPLGNEIW
ncbi:MAG: hypothetical protein FWH18_04110 [Marinilabiliaceae bacterium]|nr:hypothetical protein [Marinilabiliaceae bacterium]